jgi:hypothetical protein
MAVLRLLSKNVTAATTGKTVCSWDNINGLAPPTPCRELAVCTVTEACGHEHVTETRACPAHAESVLLEENWVCYQCATGSRPHDCPTTNVVTWDDDLGKPDPELQS